MINLFWKKLIRSFKFADEGIMYTISTQRNMKLHLVFALAVLLMGMTFHFDRDEALYVLIAIGMIFFAEITNTSIEKIVDLVTTDYNQLAKLAKDIAAGSVLFLSLVSASIGVLVFIPYFKMLFEGWNIKEIYPPSFFILLGFFILILTYGVKSYWYSKNLNKQPSIFIGIVFFLFSLVSLHLFWVIYLMIIFILIIFYLLYKKSYLGIALTQSLIISVGIFYLIYWLTY